MRFDILLMNPPYDKNVHLKFLEKTIKISDEVVSIQPVRWLQDMCEEYKKNTNYKKYEESISKHIKDLEIINSNDSRYIFGAEFTMNVGIYVCNEKNEYNIYKNIKYLRDNKDYSFIKKILSKIVEDNNYKKLTIKYFNSDLHNFIPLNNMTGENVDRCKPTCAIKEWTKPYSNSDEYVNDKKHKSGVARGKIENDKCVVFNTLEEAKNCFDSFTTTDFCRFYMSIITTDIHVYQEYMPWMSDYTKPWTDERFYKYFNISTEEQKLIKEYANKIWARLNK